VPDRVGYLRCVRIAVVGISASMVVMAAVDGVAGLVAGSALLAVGASLLYPSLAALTSNAVGDDERTSAVSTFTMFFEVANVVGGLALGAVAEVAGYRAAFGVGAITVVPALALLSQSQRFGRRAATTN
jgi:MFS family permease